MAAISPLNTQMASTLPSWRDRAIERSRVLTDGFEVALTWAGAVADWILFLCLVSNIVEVLAKLGGTAFSNIVMGTQSILLDVGGFALLTMAFHAHQRQAKRTRNSAAFVGTLLMLVTLATVVLLTVGNLWPKAADQVQGINQGLILARIGMTIVYECTIHLLRHAEQHEQQVQQAHVQQTFSEQIARIEQAFTEQVQALARTFSESIQASEHRVSEQVRGLNESFSETAQIGERLAQLSATVAGLETAWKQAAQETKEAGASRPRLSLVGASEHAVKATKERAVKTAQVAVKAASENASEKSAFIHRCLREHPDWRNSDIQRAAGEQGLTISPAHISQVRKAVNERTA